MVHAGLNGFNPMAQPGGFSITPDQFKSFGQLIEEFRIIVVHAVSERPPWLYRASAPPWIEISMPSMKFSLPRSRK